AGFLFFVRNLKKRNHIFMREIIESFKNGREVVDVPEFLKEDYIELFNEVKKQRAELDNSIEGLKEYRDELEATNNALVIKSNQLERSNEILEKRVTNMSNLNALARTVLSVDDFDKTVDGILDAYFVLTGAKRLALYLWDENILKLKKIKGNVDFNGESFCESSEVIKCQKIEYRKVYENLSKCLKISSSETIIISSLIVKGKELGVIFVVEDLDKLINIDEETISALVIQTSIAINNAQIYSDLLVKERMSSELELASKIQKKIIPQELKTIFGLDIANYFEPAKEIGGDYYDYFVHEKELLYVTMADVSGKGVPAAFLMALARSILRTISTIRSLNPHQNLNALNKIIFDDISEDMFITMMHCRFDYKTKILSYSNAGHHPIIIYRAKEDKIELHSVKGVAIGFIERYKYGEDEIKLDEGDIVLLYTDGVIEAENHEKKLFGVEKLKQIIYENKNSSSEIIKEKILKSISEFTEKKIQDDDITFVILKNNEQEKILEENLK
ncbi:MAG: PP2C family protein-serine/threonine phosphatase, partial [Fusobacteriaceae bacterium]